MQIEAGKRYVRRDGSVSGLIGSRDSVDYPFKDIESGHTLTIGGNVYRGGSQHDYDLVAEYIEPVPPSEVSGKESTVEYDLSGIPKGYEFVGYRQVSIGDSFLPNAGSGDVLVANQYDVSVKKLRIIVKPITLPEPKHRTVVIHKWLVWDILGKERMVFGTEKYIGDCGFSDAVDLGVYEEVRVNV